MSGWIANMYKNIYDCSRKTYGSYRLASFSRWMKYLRKTSISRVEVKYYKETDTGTITVSGVTAPVIYVELTLHYQERSTVNRFFHHFRKYFHWEQIKKVIKEVPNG